MSSPPGSSLTTRDGWHIEEPLTAAVKLREACIQNNNKDVATDNIWAGVVGVG